MNRHRWNPRKLLIASAGVATVNYALASGCEGSNPLVANLVVAPGDTGGSGGSAGGAGRPPALPPPGPTVANLVAPPPADLDAGQPPFDNRGDGSSAPADASSPDAGSPDAAG